MKNVKKPVTTPEKKTAKKKRKKKKPVARKSPELVLEGRLDIEDVATLKDRLVVILADSGPIVIDATQVVYADTAGLQLLTSFVTAARKQSRELIWKPGANVLQELSELLDLDRYLKISTSAENTAPENGAAVLCPVF